jgi:uncharacterized RmlC-like cupin family protein
MLQISFQPSYARPTQGMWVVDMKDLPLPDTFQTKLPPRVIYIEAGGWGGNHRHLRREAYVGLGAGLYVIWRDETGERHEAPMLPDDGSLRLFVVPSMMPHLVENRSSEPGVLYELLDIDDGPATPLDEAESLR